MGRCDLSEFEWRIIAKLIADSQPVSVRISTRRSTSSSAFSIRSNIFAVDCGYAFMSSMTQSDQMVARSSSLLVLNKKEQPSCSFRGLPVWPKVLSSECLSRGFFESIWDIRIFL